MLSAINVAAPAFVALALFWRAIIARDGDLLTMGCVWSWIAAHELRHG